MQITEMKLRQTGSETCRRRHTCASHLVMSGVDLATVKEIMRHKTIEMTLRYAHLSPEHKKSAIATLESALTPKKDKDKKAG